MKDIIIRMTGEHIKVHGGEYLHDLIRCKDCVHYHTSNDPDWNVCTLRQHYMKPEGFCSDGDTK